MEHSPFSDCIGSLLDALCYELLAGRLGAETVRVIQDHVLECASCRQSMRSYFDLLQPDVPALLPHEPFVLYEGSQRIQ